MARRPGFVRALPVERGRAPPLRAPLSVTTKILPCACGPRGVQTPPVPRARKQEPVRRTKYLRVRLTPEQSELIRKAATRAGINISSWTVERLVRAARAET